MVLDFRGGKNVQTTYFDVKFSLFVQLFCAFGIHHYVSILGEWAMKKNEMFTKIFGDGKIRVEKSKTWVKSTPRMVHEVKAKRHPRKLKYKDDFASMRDY
jgi:hypothetical protein